MPTPRQALVIGVGVVAAAAAIRRRKRGDTARNEQDRSIEPQQAKGLVHAYVSSPPSEQEQQIATQRSVPNQASMALLLVCTALILGAACVCALREQLDVVAALGLAWFVLLLSQVGSPMGLFSSKRQQLGVEAADAEMLVEEVCEPVKQLPDLNGTWIKDNAASDSMDAAMKLIHLNGMMRTAVRLIKGVNIHIDDTRFDFNVFSVISWFKVKERWGVGGEVSHNRRRDLRRGGCTGTVRVTPWGTLRLEYEWGSPHSGRGVDEFSIDDQGRLVIACSITVAGNSASYKLVYHRK